MQQEQKKVEEVAASLLDDIQYNFIHYVDCLREQKNEGLAVDSLNLLTALLSLSMGESQFIPVRADKNSTLLLRSHLVFSCNGVCRVFFRAIFTPIVDVAGYIKL